MRPLTALVVGAGALGGDLVRLLGLLGTGRVIVVDPDRVERSNLPRSWFSWNQEAIGQPKVAVLAAAARSRFSDTEWLPLEREIADVGFARIREAQIIFSCVDSDLARLEIAYIATRLNIPVADGGLAARNYSQGRISWFPGRRDACFGCMLRPSKRRELLESWDATVRPCSGEGEARSFSSTPIMSGVVAAMQLELGLRQLWAETGQPRQSYSVNVELYPNLSFTQFEIPLSRECPFHGDASLGTARSPGLRSTVQQLLDSAQATALILDWPICISAECLDCGRQWRPLQRLAALRRRGCCPGCGGQRILEREVARTIPAHSPLSSEQLSALKLPADHLFTVTKTP
jgi:adenylyltransferase/sulfurtransferase